MQEYARLQRLGGLSYRLDSGVQPEIVRQDLHGEIQRQSVQGRTASDWKFGRRTVVAGHVMCGSGGGRGGGGGGGIATTQVQRQKECTGRVILGVEKGKGRGSMRKGSLGVRGGDAGRGGRKPGKLEFLSRSDPGSFPVRRPQGDQDIWRGSMFTSGILSGRPLKPSTIACFCSAVASSFKVSRTLCRKVAMVYFRSAVPPRKDLDVLVSPQGHR